jgi:hypothetical protein
MRRARSERRPERPRVAPVLALEDDPYGPASSTAPERRTVIIQGRPEDRYRPTPSARRRQPPPHQRVGFQPDRVAMWAVLLGLVLLLVAAASSHAAVIGAHGLVSLALR